MRPLAGRPGKLSWMAGPLACGRRGCSVSYSRLLVFGRPGEPDRLPGSPRIKAGGGRCTHRFAGAGGSAGLQPFRPPGVPAVVWRMRGVIVHAPGYVRGRRPIPVEVEPLGGDRCGFEPARTVRRCSPSIWGCGRRTSRRGLAGAGGRATRAGGALWERDRRQPAGTAG